ncbi:TPA: lysis protein [Serratia marcescens]
MNTSFSFRTMAIGLLLVALIVAVRLAFYFHSNAVKAGEQVKQQEKTLAQQSGLISNLQVQQRNVAELDAKYTKELADAQKTISNLHRDVDSGAKRLRLSATCGTSHQSATAAGMDDAASPRPTNAAERDYFTLRERIEIAGKQIAGLQQYIHEQCLR